MTQKYTITLRIDQGTFEKLKQEAEKREVSFNILANRFLKRSLSWNELIPKAGIIPVRKAFLVLLMERFTEEEVTSAAKTVSKNSRDILLLVKGSYTEASVLEFLEDWVKMSGFPYNLVIENRKRKLVIQHDLGKKWSIYLGNLISQTLHDVKSKVELEFTDSTVIFTIYHSEERSHTRHF